MTPQWILSYDGKDISADIAPMTTQVTYTDYVHGKSDEIEIQLEDGNSKWRNLWYPSEGDTLNLAIGYVGQALLGCGTFEIDEIELGHSSRTATIRGLAVPVSAPMRSRLTFAYDDVTLRDVVEQVAARRSLSVVGEIAELAFRRVTQANETDLGFLRRLAEQYGYVFSVRGSELVFYPLLDLESSDPIITLAHNDLKPGTSWRGTAQETYVAAELSYMDPESGELVSVRVEADGVPRGSDNGSAAAQVTSSIAPEVVLRVGSPHKDHVRDWQRFLAGESQYSGAIDGAFGPLTKRGTRSFQGSRGLTSDGVVGPNTYSAAIDAGFRSSVDSPGGSSASGDVLILHDRVESAAEAEAVATAALRRKNRLRVSGSLKLEGRQNCISGVTLDVTGAGAGRLSGRYLVDKSIHTIARGAGYTTECEVAHVS